MFRVRALVPTVMALLLLTACASPESVEAISDTNQAVGSDTSEAPVEPTQDAADREVVGLAATEVATIDPLAAPADALPGGLYHVKTYDTGGGSVLEVFGTEQFERAMDPETGLSEELGPMIVVNRVSGGPAEALPSGRDASALTALSEELDAQVTISAVSDGEQSLIVDVKDGFIEFVGDGVDQSVLEAFALAMLDPYAEVG